MSKTTTQYRVMALKPGAKRFKEWAKLSSLTRAEAQVRVYERYSPDWEFKIESREVTTTTTNWRPV